MNNTIKNYYELCKPNVVLMMLITALVGSLLASKTLAPLSLIAFAMLGIALCASSAAAINQIIDRKTDANMNRTENRPIPQGEVSPVNASIFAFILGSLGAAILVIYVNTLTALLTLASLIGYAFVYTVYLKRATPQNIVIGGLAGAAPPLLGWTAVTNSIDPNSLLLVLIIFAWTPPHFWALAIDRMEEYRKVDIPMLPVTHGEDYTKLHILLYTLILVVTSLLPFVIGMSNVLYFLTALALGAGFLYWSLVMIFSDNVKAPLETFRYSIIYLIVLFLALLVDHYMFPTAYL